MTENELIALVAGLIDEAAAALGYELGPTIQKLQPTQQGFEDNAPYIQLIDDQPRGWPYTKAVHRPEERGFDEIEFQLVQATFQVSVFSQADPENPGKPTAQDMANGIRMYVSSRNVCWRLSQDGVNMLQPREVRRSEFVNDRDQFAVDPNFDWTITYNKQITIKTPAVYEYELKILGRV